MSNEVIAHKISADMTRASWTREMFDKGRRMKKELGKDQVFDFTLGNPNATPPDAFFEAIEREARNRQPELHRYMPNAGMEGSRAAVAQVVAADYTISIDGRDVLLTSGAAGAMNIVLRAICNPGDEVIVLAPYFSEYRFYVEQASGRMVLVQTDEHFQPDIEAIDAAITPRTRAIIVNSPNNPSGAIYTEQSCKALARLLDSYDRSDRPLYLLLDDPYRRIIYDIDQCPTVVGSYHRTLIISSYSKALSIAGERLGYIVVAPEVPGHDQLCSAFTMLNRTLGYVNASAFMQRVIVHCADALCDIDFYRKNRNLLCNALLEYGYDLQVPGGALYAFPRSPIENDSEFVDLLLEHRILAVPGKGFGRPGYVRISFCVDREAILGALPGFKAAMEKARGRTHR